MLLPGFANAIMIGGPAAAGKTTIARWLARSHGLRWYSTDAHGTIHRSRAVALGLHDPDDPSPGTFDRAPMISADLVALTAELPVTGVVVEGALISPEFAPLSRSVWLMPSETEQLRRLTVRSGSTSAEAHRGAVDGHRLITQQLDGTSATVINVDGQTINDSVRTVAEVLAAPLDDLAKASDESERRRATRYGNQVLADQLRSEIAKGHTDAGYRERRRTFDCECGGTTCRADVMLRPRDAIRLMHRPPGAVLADAHPHRT